MLLSNLAPRSPLAQRVSSLAPWTQCGGPTEDGTGSAGARLGKQLAQENTGPADTDNRWPARINGSARGPAEDRVRAVI